LIPTCTLCCTCLCLIPAWFTTTAAAEEYDTTTHEPSNEWGLTTNMILDQMRLCETFHLTSKPYFMLTFMAITNLLATSIFFGEGRLRKDCAGYFALAYLLYIGVAIVWEFYDIAREVYEIDSVPSFQNQTTNSTEVYYVSSWDRYELTGFLWIQSSAGANVANLLYTAMIYLLFTADEEPDPTAKGGPHVEVDMEVETKPLGEEPVSRVQTLVSKQDRGTIRACLFCSCILPLLPFMVTHLLPMLVLYGYMMSSFIFVAMLLTLVIMLVATTYGGAHNCCLYLCSSQSSGTAEGPNYLAVAKSWLTYSPVFFYILYIILSQTMVTYAILLYGRGFEFYVHNIAAEFHSRKTSEYIDCNFQGHYLTVIDTLRTVF